MIMGEREALRARDRADDLGFLLYSTMKVIYVTVISRKEAGF
jgi:hypothetical protein